MASGKAARWRRHSGFLLKAAAAACLLFLGLRDVSPQLYQPGSPTEVDTIQSGEMLLHGFNFGVWSENFHLPLATVSGALLANHSGPEGGVTWRKLSAAAALVLILALGVELGGAWIGLLGAALLQASSRAVGVDGLETAWHGQWGHLQTFHALLALAAAGAAARHARAPSLASAAAAAAALGAALLYRSTFVFLPPLLALLYVLRERRSALDRRQAALLGAAPYLFLLPWIAMNWSVHRSFIPLEHAEAAPIIVGGVLGSVDKDPSPELLSDLGLKGAGTFEVLAWAVPKALARPGDFARGCLRRLARIALMSPLLLLLAALALWRRRRRPEAQVVGAFCAYLIVIHSFMSFLVEYFEPLWPLLAVLAGALPAAAGVRPSPTEGRAAGAARDAFLGAILLLCLYVYGTLAGYARAAAGGDEAAADRRLEEALRRHPREAEFHFHRGVRRRLAGDAEAAAADFDAAARLQPGNERLRRRAAWSGLSLGRPAAFLSWLSGAEAARDAEALLLKAFGTASAGRRGEARAAAAAYRALPSAQTASLGAELRGALRPFIAVLCGRGPVLADLSGVCRDNAAFSSLALRREADLLLNRADAARTAGKAAEASDLLARAAALGPDDAGLRRLAAQYQSLKEHVRAAAVLDGLIARAPRDPALRVERAAFALDAGDREASRAFLASALALEPDEAVRLRARGLSEKARDRSPGSEARHGAALVYQKLGDYPAALALFEGLVREHPADAVYRGDLGLCRYLSGDEETAIADLKRALELDPGLEAAALTLEAIRAARR